MRQRIRCYSSATVVPILYRSHLFTPISHDSPSVLLDLINAPANGHSTGFVQKRIHFTLYHLSYRYDVDSSWIQRLSGLLPQRKEAKVDDPIPVEKTANEKVAQNPTMTRVRLASIFIRLHLDDALTEMLFLSRYLFLLQTVTLTTVLLHTLKWHRAA
jgi:hypothetical protein